MSGHITIKVEQKHIDQSTPNSSAKCMVAEAIRDAIPGSKKLHADMQTLRYTDKLGVRRTFLTPSAVQASLARYDAGDPVGPFAPRLPHAMHISKPVSQILTNATRTRPAAVTSRSVGQKARVGGKGVPMLGNATRRRFGIRNLRINQQGQVVQSGLITTEETETK